MFYKVCLELHCASLGGAASALPVLAKQQLELARKRLGECVAPLPIGSRSSRAGVRQFPPACEPRFSYVRLQPAENPSEETAVSPPPSVGMLAPSALQRHAIRDVREQSSITTHRQPRRPGQRVRIPVRRAAD